MLSWAVTFFIIAIIAAVFGFGDAHERFLRHGIDRVIVGFASENEAHESFGLMKEGIGLMHWHMPVSCHRLL